MPKPYFSTRLNKYGSSREKVVFQVKQFILQKVEGGNEVKGKEYHELVAY